MQTLEMPNLDCLTDDPAELRTIGAALAVAAKYADTKAQAMRHRLEGNIGVALILERDCDRLYQSLPQWARW